MGFFINAAKIVLKRFTDRLRGKEVEKLNPNQQALLGMFFYLPLMLILLAPIWIPIWIVLHSYEWIKGKLGFEDKIE